MALGLGGATEAGPTSAEISKRAYLKQVRRHPPEQDRQGFQRVREAYELLRGLERARSPFRSVELVKPQTAIEREGAAPPEALLTGSPFERLCVALNAGQHGAVATALLEIPRDRPAKSGSRCGSATT